MPTKSKSSTPKKSAIATVTENKTDSNKIEDSKKVLEKIANQDISEVVNIRDSVIQHQMLQEGARVAKDFDDGGGVYFVTEKERQQRKKALNSLVMWGCVAIVMVALNALCYGYEAGYEKALSDHNL